MKKAIFLSIFCAVCAFGADRIYYHDIALALESDFAKDMLKNDIKLSFSKTLNDEALDSASVRKSSSRYRGGKYNPKTNKRERVDDGFKRACEFVFVSAIAYLQDLARKENKSEVVNIQGNFKGNTYDSKDKFQCAAGRMITTVSLKANLK